MSRKLKYSAWIFLLHVYAVLFSGPRLWRALMTGLISVAVFCLFAWMGLTVAWVILAVGLALLKLVLNSYELQPDDDHKNS